MNHNDITPNESQLTLVTTASDCEGKNATESPLTNQESALEAPATPESSPKTTAACKKRKETASRCSHIQVICVMLTVSTLVIVVGVTVPVLFYYLLVGEGSKLFQGREASSRSSCLPEVYIGAVCQNSLQSYQVENRSQIFVASVLDQEATESQAILLLSDISNMQPNVTSECVELLTDFSCLLLFGLCTDNETLLLPSPEQCMIIEDTCNRGLKSYADTLGVSINCSDIENQSPVVSGSSALGNSNITNNITVCSEDFYLGEDGLCRAECSKFEYWPHHIEVIFNAVFIVAIVVGTSGGVVVIVVSCIRRKKLLTYPSVFIVYQTITMLLYEFAVLVGRFDQATLFCSSVDLEESLRNPTAFCSFSGVIFMYIQLQLWIWLFFHVFSLFWGLKFPFHYRSYLTSGRIKYIHIAMIVIGIFIPIVPAFLPFAVNGYVYSIRVPPVFCVPIDISLFVYPLALPVGLLSLSAMVFFLYIFWIITKLREKKSSKSSTITTPEAKILFLTSSFLFGGVGAIVGGAVFLYRFNETTETLIAYLNCESAGINGNTTCDRSSFESAYYPYQGIFDLGNIGSVLYPAFNLIYVVEVQKVKKWLSGQSISKSKSK